MTCGFLVRCLFGFLPYAHAIEDDLVRQKVSRTYLNLPFIAYFRHE